MQIFVCPARLVDLQSLSILLHMLNTVSGWRELGQTKACFGECQIPAIIPLLASRLGVH